MLLLKPLRAGRKMASVLDLSQQESVTEGVANVTGLESANALSCTISAIFAALSFISYFEVGVGTRFVHSISGPDVSLNKISGTLPPFEFANLSHFSEFVANPISGFMPDPMNPLASESGGFWISKSRISGSLPSTTITPSTHM
jgi:hypothetical protein